jgi:uncharacterized repeat protein (TIGR01451 family)
MKKLFPLTAVGLSLLILLSYSVFLPSNSDAAPALQDEAPTATPPPRLTISKGVTPVTDLDDDGVIDPGDTVSYTISYKNAGVSTATNVTIVDDYDESFIAEITNISPEGKNDKKTITWEIGTVEAGEGGSVSYAARLKKSFPPGSTDVTNQATIKVAQTPVANSTRTVAVAGPNLTIDKKVTLVTDLDKDKVIDPGDTVRYTISYENSGGGEATGVTIVDVCDESFIASVDEISPGGEKDGNTITWDLETVAADTSGSVTYNANLKSKFPPGTTDVTNQATIKVAQTPVANSTRTVAVTGPNLTIDKKVTLVTDLDKDKEIDPGDTVRYTISYKNSGGGEATDVTIVDVYDERFIASADEISPGGVKDGNTITWNLGTVAAGASGSVTYNAKLKSKFPPGTTEVTNQATIKIAQTPCANSTRTVVVKGLNLTIDKKVTLVTDLDKDGVIDPGDTVRYTISYKNSGGGEAAGVTIVDDYAENLIASVDEISHDGVDDGNTITWNLGTVTADDGGSVTYDVRLKIKFPPDTTSIDSTATIKSGETSLSNVMNSVPIKVANLTIDKKREPGLVNDLNGNGIADPGDTIKYNITYENKGNGDATDVIIVDDYPETLITSIVNITGDGKKDESTITWELDTLAAGDSGSLSYEATLQETFPPGPTSVKNSVTISSKEMEPAGATETIKVEVTPTPTPTPTPSVQRVEKDPSTGIFAEAEMARVASILILVLTSVAMLVLLIVGIWTKYCSKNAEEAGKLNRQRIEMVREGIFLIFIVSAVLILAIGSGIESDGAISILSAIVGYVFGRTASRSR